VVHEVRHAWDRLRRHLEAVDQGRLAARGRKERRRLLAVHVERKPNRHAAPFGFDDGSGHQLGRRLQKVEVVEREVEAPAGRVEEAGEAVGDRECRLAPVGEGVHLDHEARP
jgi:transposase InsO family protein